MAGTQVEKVQSESVTKIKVAAASRLIVLAPPWVGLVLLAVVGAVSHGLWGKPPAVAWAAMAGTFVTLLLTLLTFLVAHSRGPIGRVHSTATTAGAGLWFTVVTVAGFNGVTWGGWFFGGLTICLAWNIRGAIRGGESDGRRGGDALARLFEESKESFGLRGASVRTREVSDHRIKATMALPAGEKTAADVTKKAAYLESGMELPPGSVQVTADRDNAAQAHMTVTDPRVLNKPIPWPGPSRPGGSIAEPARIGVFQDSEYAEPILTGNHLQIMGASGSGKSIGGAWNLAAEAITRRDVALFVVDLAKDDQTFGPLRPALHRFETTKAGASAFVRALHEEIPKRTKWLARNGYADWEPGCGLAYWIVFFEEVAKVFDILGQSDQERIEQIAKEIRSAGGRIVMSLQRATYGEMPTIVRSQLAKMCFGLTDEEDAGYGLSERQKRADVSPELWGAGNPEHVGKAFLDAVGVSDQHAVMALRTFTWGSTARAAVAAMTEYAAQWPAAAREMDEFTRRLSDPAAVLGGVVGGQAVTAAAARPELAPAAAVDQDDDENAEHPDEAAEDAAAAADHLTTEDPDPEVQGEADDEIPDLPETGMQTAAAPAPSRTPAEARAMVEEWLRECARTGRLTVAATDDEFAAVRDAAGMGRSWGYKVLKDFADSGILRQVGKASYEIDLDALRDGELVLA